MTPAAQVRRAVDADADAVFALTTDFATSFRPERSRFDQAWGRLLRQDEALLMVAEQDGQVAGYLLGFDHLTLFANGRVGWIEELMVAPEQRSRGHGRRLVAAFERWAKSRGSAMVALATRRAAGFYSAIGYAESATYFRKTL